MTPEEAAEALKLDESRYTGDGGDLVLLHSLRKTEQAIEIASPDAILAALPPIHAVFLKLLVPTPTPTLPKPGRPIRHLLTRCLISIHNKIESRSLFDFVQALLKGITDGGGKNMGNAENVMRVAGWFVVGEIIKELGANMMSFMAEITTASVKVLRNSNLSIILRTHAIQAFTKSLYSAGRAIPDSLVKDTLKALRAGLQDKALPIQRACAEAFVGLNIYTSATPLQPTLDSVLPLVYKSLETADYLTRRSLSRLISHLLAKTQEPGSGVPVVELKRVVKKDGEVDGNEPNVITSAPEDRTGRTLYTPQEMLKCLSVTYNKPATPRKLRNAIVDIYSSLLTTLGADYVENHYSEIVKHLIDEIVLPARASSTRYEVLSTRESVGILLRDLIGVRLLSEAGQVMAIREWANTYLKKWSLTPLPGTVNMHKHALIVGLREVAGLLEQLGNAPPSILELLAEPLVRLLSHESYSVRVTTAYTLRRFCTINPSQLPKMLNILLVDVTKELSVLGSPAAPRELPQRILGKTFALSALMAVSPSRPLYVSHDMSSKIFDLAVSLLKKAGEHDISTSTTEVQVAWYLIASLMSLGPGFVKMHLPQLLVLWRNALPKPTTKDSSVGERGEPEWSFLLLVRECTLAAVLNFLRHNSSLVNIDVARRLATLFTNSLNFVNGFATAYAEALREQAANNPNSNSTPAAQSNTPSLVEREANLRRRVLQCFTSLGPSSATDSMQSALLQAAITVFADPENYSGSAAQAAIAAQAGQFQGVWGAVDGYAFGVTSLLGSRELEGAERDEGFLNRDKIEMAIESQLSHPIIGSLEHDFLDLLSSKPLPIPPNPAPPQTGVIDSGVELFAAMFAYQNVEGMVQSLGTLSSHVRSSKLEKNPGRRQAVVANTMAVLRRSLVNADAAGARAKKVLGSVQVSDMIKALLQEAVLDPQPSIRQAAADCMGLLSSIAGNNYLTSQIQWLVDQVVNNRIPDSRAGCALAFGSIYSNVGGLAGGPILKTIVNILMSLATDPHPIVHFWAMVALAQVINAANLSYEPFVTNTLGMLSSIYLLDTHEPDGGSLGSVNLRGDLPAYQAMCRILHAITGVIGPELQEPGRVRSLVFLLVHEFGEETDEGLAVEAIKCVQQFLMFAPAEVDIPGLLSRFRTLLASSRRPLKGATITALYQIVQRDAVLISKLGGNQLVEDLFGLLDDDPGLEGVKNVITAWLQQTASSQPSGWIDLCQRIMTRTAASAAAQRAQQAKANGPQFIDDEGESFAGEAGSSANSTGLTSRWRTQLFALQCLHNIIQAVIDGNRPEHFDPNLAQSLGLNSRQMLFSRVADLIRMAFSASAALVMEVRIQGLIVLRDVVLRFATSADPDFEGSLLLEQHQAPIAAALTPSFGSDSAPEVLALAVQVCAVFVGSGVVKEVVRMGRILKLLTGALEQCKDGDTLCLGDSEELSTNASVMLKISILAAWAELEVAGVKQAYLKDVIDPYRWLLGPYWIGALRDYAGLRADPEMGMGLGGSDLGQGLGRDVLLPYYEQSVPKLLHAVAITLAKSDLFALGAMDGQTYTSPTPPTSAPTIRPEPCVNFYTMYGLAFETLVKSMGDSNTTSMACVALRAMTSLVKPQLSGTTVFDGAFFDELCTVAYRIGVSEPATVKTDMLEVMASFVVFRKGVQATDQAQTRRALAVVTYTLRQIISSPEVRSVFNYSDSASERIVCLRAGFSAFGRITDCIDPVQRGDLCAVGIHLFVDLLKEESPMDLAGACLSALKGLVDQCIVANGDMGAKVIHGLISACLTNIDEMRTRVNPVASVKIKNNLLAVTLLLTTLSPSTQISKPLIEQVGYTLTQYLNSADRPELGLTAIHCATAFLSASLRPTGPNGQTSPVLSHASLYILPGLVGYLAESVVVSATSASGSGTSTTEGVKEVIKALVTWTTGLSEDLRPRGYAVLLPSLSLLLDQTPGQSSQLHMIGTTTLLGLAQNNPKAFRDATMGMEEADRGRLEKGIRDAVGGGSGQKGAAAGAGSDKKGIELRSFG